MLQCMGEGAELFADSRECLVCHRLSDAKHHCPIYSGLLGQKRKGRKADIAARRDALREQWNKELRAFTCKYTGIALTHNGGARNAEWEHRTPGDESSVVLVAALVNRMKADLNEDQWDAMVSALFAHRIEGKPFDESALPLNWQPKASSWRNGH